MDERHVVHVRRRRLHVESGSRLNTTSSASVMSLQRCQTTPLLRRGTHSHFPTTALRAVIVSSALRVGLSRPLRFMGGSTGMAGHSPRPSDRRQHLSSGRQLASSKVSSPNAHAHVHAHVNIMSSKFKFLTCNMSSKFKFLVIMRNQRSERVDVVSEER